MRSNNIKFRQYLLKTLPDQDMRELDLAIISGAVPEEELAVAADDLMEDYLESALSSEEAKLFGEQFLTSDARFSELTQINALRNYAQKAKSAAEPMPNQAGLFDSILNSISVFLKGGLRPVAASLAIVLLVLAGIVGWRVFFAGSNPESNAGNTAMEREIAQLNADGLGDLAKFQDISQETLTPGVFRGSGGKKEISATELTERVLFRLTLPPGVAGRFSASLFRGESVVFTAEKLPVHENANGKELRLIVPSNLLKNGEFKIKISPAVSPDMSADYPFNVR
jgi:hypothetical protein